MVTRPRGGAGDLRAGRDRRSLEAASLERRARIIATVRLALAALALAAIGAIVWGHLGAGLWWALGADVAAFLAMVVVHARVHDARERASAALRFHQRGLSRLDHAWDALPSTSQRFQSADHPFASDLDVFGHGSVMQLVDATETRFGEERLAKLLSLEDPGAWPDDVAARQQAVRDVAGRAAFREALATAGGVLADEKPDPAPLLAWAEDKGGLQPAMSSLGVGARRSPRSLSVAAGSRARAFAPASSLSRCWSSWSSASQSGFA